MRKNIRKNIRKITAFVSAFAVIISGCMTGAAEAVFELHPDVIEVAPVNRLAAPSFADTAFSVPEFRHLIDSDEDNIIPSVRYTASDESVELTNDTLPASFDMRSCGMITSVKDQGSNGTCWSFAASASAETALIKSVPSVDLSELHGAYFSYYSDEQIDIGECTVGECLDYGGNRDVIVNLWSQWIGPVNESVLPYDDTDVLENAYYAQELYKKSDFHLENAYMFDYTKDRSNFESVNGLVKQFVYSGNAVDVSFYSNNSTAYNRNESASFCTEKPKKANHSVVIAGWDDNFPASSFNEYNGAVPENDGAWLVKNSWGATLGDYGYMWISYEDTSLCEFTVFDMSSSENYTSIYNHDTYIPAQTMSAGEDTEEKYASYMANIFTAGQDEQVEAVSTYINNAFTEYEITVYTDLSDPSDPSSGTASSVTRGVSELTGYITIELDENVIVDKGEKYSVAVKLYNNETNFVIPLETSMILQDYETGEISELSDYASYEQICRYTGENESFYSADGKDWCDVTDENYIYTEEEKEELIASVAELLEEDGESQEVIDAAVRSYRELFSTGELMVVMGNISLKAFANPVNTVDFSHISGAVSADERVALSVKDSSDIYCSINGGDSFLYTQPIGITGNTVITASADGVNFTQRKYYPEKAEFNSIGYSKRASAQTVVLEYAERINESSYVINLGGATENIRLFPVSGADILMNGVPIENNMPTEQINLDYGSNVITFELSGGNSESSVVTLTINRAAAEFDLESETVTIYGGHTLTAEDGTVISDGNSVSAYAGQLLTCVIDGEAVEYRVPERAVMPECTIDYVKEALGGFSAESVLTIEYDVTGDGMFISAGSRLTASGGENGGCSIRVIPGETLSVRVGAGNGMFAGEAVTYIIPAAEMPPAAAPIYTENRGILSFSADSGTEYGIASHSFDEADFEKTAEDFGYTSEAFEALMFSRYGASGRSELMKMMSAEWGITEAELSYDRNAEIVVRYPADERSFASAAVLYRITTDKYDKGDVNGDGKVNAIDATMVLKHYADISLGGDGLLTNVQRYAADYDDNALVNASDATRILMRYADDALSN